MCDWQKEQDRLRTLWEDPEETIVEEEDSDEEKEIDHLSINSDYSDEQEADNEGQIEVQERQHEEIDRFQVKESEKKICGKKWFKMV